MLKKSDGWCRERRVASPDTESRPISRRHPRQLSRTHCALAPKEPREQTVGMLIAFPKAQRFMKLSGDVKNAAWSHGQPVGKSTIWKSGRCFALCRCREFDWVKNIELSRPEAHNPPRERRSSVCYDAHDNQKNALERVLLVIHLCRGRAARKKTLIEVSDFMIPYQQQNLVSSVAQLQTFYIPKRN